MTNDATPTVRLFAERGAFVRFYLDGVLSAEAYSTGVAMVTAMPLSDGQHQVTATVEDFTGNVSSQTPPLTISVDTIAPAVPDFELDEASQQFKRRPDSLGNGHDRWSDRAECVDHDQRYGVSDGRGRDRTFHPG